MALSATQRSLFKLQNCSLVISCLSTNSASDIKPSYDAIVVGGGHNGLVSAAYLAKAGHQVAVFERRHVLGGAAVTEEIVPGFKFSRASYLLSLFRPIVMEELELKKHGLKYYIKNPSSFTPMRKSNKSLLMGSDPKLNYEQIAQFSKKDAEAFPKYEHQLNSIIDKLEPLLDMAPVDVLRLRKGTRGDWSNAFRTLRILSSLGAEKGMAFYEIMTSPISKVLNSWFESEPLMATLATDGVVGFSAGPHSPGTGYVLLHHVMGELDGQRGAWAFVRGGMGAVSQAIASSARQHGAEMYVNQSVKEFTSSDGKINGVVLEDGRSVSAKVVLSNATPKVSFLDLTPQNLIPADFLTKLEHINYSSPATKLNVALNKLPRFACLPGSDKPMPHHGTTIHFNSETVQQIQDSYMDYANGTFSKKPMIEMTLPSVRDDSISPPGSHVALLFTQYTPYHLAGGRSWDEATKTEYANVVFDSIEDYCPGFKESIVGYEILTPPDLEATFGLTGGNIFHGSMSMDQLFFTRPTSANPSYQSHVEGLYLCGSGGHPGGGVTGGPGRLAALAVMKHRNLLSSRK